MRYTLYTVHSTTAIQYYYNTMLCYVNCWLRPSIRVFLHSTLLYPPLFWEDSTRKIHLWFWFKHNINWRVQGKLIRPFQCCSLRVNIFDWLLIDFLSFDDGCFFRFLYPSVVRASSQKASLWLRNLITEMVSVNTSNCIMIQGTYPYSPCGLIRWIQSETQDQNIVLTIGHNCVLSHPYFHY